VHEPERHCIGCGEANPKQEMLRLALDGDLVVADHAADMPGRGAYVCSDDCLRNAVGRRALARAFRKP
jgi:predicted RNA-binding protein YlxR (DUF448 family)